MATIQGDLVWSEVNGLACWLRERMERQEDTKMGNAMTLTAEECRALYSLIDELSGGNPENVFAWDGQDDLANPTTSACAKLFRAADHDEKVPPVLRGHVQ